MTERDGGATQSEQPDAATVTDLCNPNPCAATVRTRCVTDGGSLQCRCAPPRVDTGSACESPTTCTPVVCAELVNSACIERAQGIACVCALGFVEDETGTCTLSGTCVGEHAGGIADSFEPDDCPSKANAVVPVNGLLTGHSVRPFSDVDWFRFDAIAGHIYEFGTPGTLLANLDVSLFAADAVTPQALLIDTARESFRFIAPSSGRVFLRIAGSSSQVMVDYDLVLRDLSFDDHGNSAPFATTVSQSSTPGQLEYPRDVDVFRVPLMAGHTYSLRAVPSWGLTLGVHVLDENGDTIGRAEESRSLHVRFSDGGFALAEVQKRGSEDGGFVGAWEVQTGSYSFAVVDRGADDFAELPTQATPFALGPINGRFEFAEDIDSFTISATAGHAFFAQCTAPSSGCVAAFSEPSLGPPPVGSAEELHTFDTSGTKIVSVRPMWATNQPYTLNVYDLGVDTVGDTPLTATPLQTGSAFTSTLAGTYDRDVFAASGIAGRLYLVTCTPSAPLSGCSIEIRDPNGGVIASDTNRSVFEAPVTGSYLITLAATAGAGSYVISFEDKGVDNAPATPAGAPTLTVGQTRTGRIDLAGDVDVFTLQVAPDHWYKLSYSLSSTNCKAEVRSSSGALWAQQSACGSSYFRASTADTFSVSLSSWTYQALIDYSVSVDDLGADDAPEAIATAATLTPPVTNRAGVFEAPPDVDSWNVTVTPGHMVRASCGLDAGTGSCRVELRGDPNRASVSMTAGQPTSVKSNGGYVAAYFRTVGASSPLAAYAFTIEDLGADDYADDAAAATALTLGAAVAGSLGSNDDVDAFSFVGTAAVAYNISVGTGIVADVRTSTGGFVKTINGSGNFVPATDGQYFLFVRDPARNVTTYTLLVQ